MEKNGTLNSTMYREGKISTSDYRMWFHLNNKTKISILTLLGETDGATIMNGIGQGSFAVALASSLNIGCAVEGIKKVNLLGQYWRSRTKKFNFPGRHCKDESHDGGCQKRCKRRWQIVRNQTVESQHAEVPFCSNQIPKI